MIDVYHLASAAPIAMFGMLALWAAASKRHWFLRTVIVAAAVLATLLIPAYELAYQLGIESVVVVGGMAIWRRRRLRSSVDNSPHAPRYRFSLSLETLMLAVVIVAVSTAVIARTPQIESHQWQDLAISGAVSGAICLTSVWLSCGEARWPMRLIAAPFLIVVLGASMHILKWAGAIVRYRILSSAPLADYLQIAWGDTWPGISFWIIAVGLGMVVLCAWLLLMRTAGWFDPFPDTAEVTADTPVAQRRRVRARCAAVVLFCAASLFPIALFYRLLTPTPIPRVNPPVPNGFDDFVAAGRMVGPTAAAKLMAWDQLTDAQLALELAKLQGAFERLHEGLKKECWHPYVFKPWVQEDAQALTQLFAALFGQAAFARRSKDLEKEVANYIDLLRLAHAESRGMAADDYDSIFGQYEWDAYSSIWGLRTRFSAAQCKRIAVELWELDRRREPWAPRDARQRIIEENAGWRRHSRLVLDEWSGRELKASRRIEHSRRVTELRMLIIELILRAYELDHGRLPTRLSELVPDYLPAVPQDPFGDSDLQYRAAGDSYELYSIGSDGVDDGGNRVGLQNGEEVGDFTPVGLFERPVVRSSP